MTKLEQLQAIASRADLSLAERHAQLRAIDPTAALNFSRVNHAALSLELRRGEAAAAEQARVADAKLAEQLPVTPHLTVYERAQQTDSVGAAIFHRAHGIDIARERAERDAALAELDPGPDAA